MGVSTCCVQNGNRVLFLLFLLGMSIGGGLRKAGTENENRITFITEEIIASYNFPYETHFMRTSDGYILRIVRIPGKQGQSLEVAKRTKKKPLVLQHGFVGASDMWVLNGEKYSPAFYFAQLGYDVWLPNFRG